MKKLIYILFGCDCLKGFLNNPEDCLFLSKIKFFRVYGRCFERWKKKKRLNIIQCKNDKLPKPQLVSIILPVLNAEKTIRTAVESIQKQSYRHWELLIIDDGSSDNSFSIISELSYLDSRIRVYKNTQNKGAAYTRNVGLFHAQGDYLTFHDADDISHVERLEYQLVMLLSNANTRIAVVQYVRVDPMNEILVLNGKKKRNYISGMMFTRSSFEKIGYFKPLKISEDSEYYERMVAALGKKSRKILCKTLYYALFSPDSLLFSNAVMSFKGNSINYKIVDEELALLESLRDSHRLISSGNESPYQVFLLDKETKEIS